MKNLAQDHNTNNICLYVWACMCKGVSVCDIIAAIANLCFLFFYFFCYVLLLWPLPNNICLYVWACACKYVYVCNIIAAIAELCLFLLCVFRPAHVRVCLSVISLQPLPIYVFFCFIFFVVCYYCGHCQTIFVCMFGPAYASVSMSVISLQPLPSYVCFCCVFGLHVSKCVSAISLWPLPS
jgi:hypothetical protein